MKEDFLKNIDMNQGIIHKIVNVYENDPEDKKDLFQEILYQLWKSYPSFENRSAFSTWMYRIALNTTLLRQRKKYSMKKEREAMPLQSSTTMHDSENRISLHMAINQLNQVDRAISLLYLEQKDYQEIADIMGMTKNNIGVRINRIKKQLKKVLDYERGS